MSNATYMKQWLNEVLLCDEKLLEDLKKPDSIILVETEPVMTVGHLLNMLNNVDKDAPIEGVSEVNYILNRNGSVVVRFV